MGKTPIEKTAVLISGPSSLAAWIGRYIRLLLPGKQPLYLADIREVDHLGEIQSNIYIAIFFDLQTSFTGIDNWTKLVRKIRVSDLRFPIILLSLDECTKPIFKEKGHMALKMPTRLATLNHYLTNQRDLAYYEWKTVVNKYCKPTNHLVSIVMAFQTHGIENLRNGRTEEYMAFKKDFMDIWRIRRDLFWDDMKLMKVINDTHESITAVDQALTSSEASKLCSEIETLSRTLGRVPTSDEG